MTQRRLFPERTTVTPTKTSLENITLFHFCYFTVILTRSTSTQTTNYPGTKLVGVAFKLRKRMKNAPSCSPQNLNFFSKHCAMYLQCTYLSRAKKDLGKTKFVIFVVHPKSMEQRLNQTRKRVVSKISLEKTYHNTVKQQMESFLVLSCKQRSNQNSTTATRNQFKVTSGHLWVF